LATPAPSTFGVSTRWTAPPTLRTVIHALHALLVRQTAPPPCAGQTDMALEWTFALHALWMSSVPWLTDRQAGMALSGPPPPHRICRSNRLSVGPSVCPAGGLVSRCLSVIRCLSAPTLALSQLVASCFAAVSPPHARARVRPGRPFLCTHVCLAGWVSAGVLRHALPVAGVVVEFSGGPGAWVTKTYAATRNGGATLNGKPISVSRTSELRRSLLVRVATGSRTDGQTDRQTDGQTGAPAGDSTASEGAALAAPAPFRHHF
jgi:Inositol monophosphatase family